MRNDLALGVLRSHPQRFRLRILDVDESYRMLSEAIDRLLNTSPCRTLLTVSPVPMQATFSGEDLHIARLDSFDDDNVHVRDDVVETVVGYMRQNYVRVNPERPVQNAD